MTVRIPEPDEEATVTRSPRKKRGALLSEPPAKGADRRELLDWVSEQLRLPSPLVRVERWGRSGVAPVHLVLVDGRVIRFAEATDLNRSNRLVEQIGLALGKDAPQLPDFARSDAQQVFTATLRAADLLEGLDAVEQARGWQDSLNRVTRELHHGSYDDPAARWAALWWLRNEPDFDAGVHRRAFTDERYRLPVLVWSSGVKYVRVDDVVRYVRGVLDERVASQQVVGRMVEAGWEHVRAESRRPGAGRARAEGDRVRVSVFLITASGDAPTNSVSPTSPIGTPAPAPAPARREAWGSLGTPKETPIRSSSDEPGDTKEAGDTTDAPEHADPPASQHPATTAALIDEQFPSDTAAETTPTIADYFAPSANGQPAIDAAAWGREWVKLGGRPPEDPVPVDPGETLLDALGSEQAVVGAFLSAFGAVELPLDDPRALAFDEEAS